MLLLFAKDRDGEVVNKDLLKDIVQSFVLIGMQNAEPKKLVKEFTWGGKQNFQLYEKEFEHHFLANARKEYIAKANLWIQECSAPEYLRKVDQALDHEQVENKGLFEDSTMVKLVKILDEELITLKA